MMRVLALCLLLIPGPQESGRDEAIRTAYDKARPSIVSLEILFRKKSPMEKADVIQEIHSREDQILLDLGDNQFPLQTYGISVDDKGHVVVPDLHVRPGDITKVSSVDWKGHKSPAKLVAIGLKYDSAVFQLEKPGPELKPLAFVKFEPFGLGTNFHVTYVDRVDERVHINVSPYIVTDAPLTDQKNWKLLDQVRRGAVIGNAKGEPVGIAMDQYLWTHENGLDSFLGDNVKADKRLSFEDLGKLMVDTIRKVGPRVGRFEIRFRQDPEVARYGGGGKPASVFGLPIDERGAYLIPGHLPAEWIRRIDEVQFVDGFTRKECEFVGQFKQFAAMIVRVKDHKTNPAIDRKAKRFAPGELLLTATLEARFGRVRVRMDYNRFFRTKSGLNGKNRLSPRRAIKQGAFLVATDGRVAGFFSADKKELSLQEQMEEMARMRYGFEYYSGYVSDYLKRPFFFGELEDELGEPSAHFDPRATPQSKKAEQQPVWIGVEFQPLDKELAKLLEIQEQNQTDDGRKGLLVTDVYPGSPAEKLGIQKDDVLLTVFDIKNKKTTDLAPQRGGPFGQTPFFGLGTPWRPAKNYLNDILTRIGAGQKIRVTYLRARKKHELEVALEQAPPNYETAERYKNEKLGITVRNLTYEVRYFQKLNPGFAGVVVSKIEGGGRAEVSKLRRLSIVTKANDEPVTDTASFKKLIEAFLASESRSITLQTLLMGETKLVELTKE